MLYDPAVCLQVASDDEIRVLEEILDLKAQYRDAYGDLQLARSEAEYTAGLIEACRQEMVAGFEAWYETQAAAAAASSGGGVGDRLGFGPAAGGVMAESAGSGGASSAGGGLPLGSFLPSRQPSAASTSSMLLGGLPLPSIASPSYASSAPRTPQEGSLAGSGWRSGGGSKSVPLASIVAAAAAAAEAQGDAAAAAYYGAQQHASTWRAPPGMLRPGSMKKHRTERGTFSVTQRSAITDTAPSQV